MQDQDNNNFQTIISTWRRLSGEQIESPVSVSMSGDSNSYDLFRKKEEESNLLVPERAKVPLATIASAEVAGTAVDIPPENMDKDREEKQEFIKYDRDDSKDGSGDTNQKDEKVDKDYLENNDIGSKSSDNKWDKDKYGDKVDAVFIRRPPPEKSRSAASTVEEEDCGIKCLYYTLQCCDCVLM